MGIKKTLAFNAHSFVDDIKKTINLRSYFIYIALFILFLFRL